MNRYIEDLYAKRIQIYFPLAIFSGVLSRGTVMYRNKIEATILRTYTFHIINLCQFCYPTDVGKF